MIGSEDASKCATPGADEHAPAIVPGGIVVILPIAIADSA